jgi:hypothetical protein
MTNKADSTAPLTVRMGVLTDEEFARLKPDEQIEVDRQTNDLCDRYGPGFCARERDRLRTELSFIYGVIEPPLPFVSSGPSSRASVECDERHGGSSRSDSLGRQRRLRARDHEEA